MNRLLIIGAGSHGRVVGEVAKACGYEIAYLDDQPGENVIGSILELDKYKDQYNEFFVGIGNNRTREVLIERLEKNKLNIATLIHPTAYVSSSASIGIGTIIEPMALVNTNSRIGIGCILSVGSIIDHDVELEDFVHINAGAICKGGSKVTLGKKIDAGEVVQGF